MYSLLSPNVQSLLDELDRQEGKDKEPKLRGYWADINGKPIKKTRVGNVVKFKFETENVESPKGKKITFQLKEYDTSLPIIFFGVPIVAFRPFDDEINIITTDRNNVKQIQKEVYLDDKGNAELTILLTDNLNKLITNGELGALELYFDCEFDGGHLKLPTSTQEYLSVILSEKDIYIKPATNGDSFPEFLTTLGEVIKFSVSELEPGKVSNLRTTKFMVNKTLKYAHEINEVIREVHIDKINLKEELVPVKKYTEIVEDMFFSNAIVKPKDGLPEPYFSNLSYEARKLTISSIKKPIDYINIKDMKNLTHEFLRKCINFVDYVDVVSVFLGENKDIGTLLSLFGGMYSPLSFAAKFLVDYELKEINETLDEWGKVSLANAKYKGLEAVKDFMKSPIATRENGYKLLDIPEELYLKIMRGEVIKYADLQNKIQRIQNSMSIENYNKIADYHLILKPILDSSRNDNIYLIETIIH